MADEERSLPAVGISCLKRQFDELRSAYALALGGLTNGARIVSSGQIPPWINAGNSVTRNSWVHGARNMVIERTVPVLLGLAASVAAAAGGYGWWIGEALNGLLLSMLPGALLVVAAVVVSLRPGGRSLRLARAGWIVFSILGYLVAYLFCNRAVEGAFKDGETVLVYIMLILSFPAGLLSPIAIAKWTDAMDPNLRLAFEWLCFFAAGCLQWFVLLRRLSMARPAG
jgi:hypothetical protein